MRNSNRALLTGAGFTHNFGAPLANGIRDLLFGHPEIRGMSNLHELMRDNFDFEWIYNKVLTSSDYSDQEKSGIRNAVEDVYQSIDEEIRNCRFTHGSRSPVNLYGVRDLVKKFAGTNRMNPGFFFTLNQDLFIERYYADGPTLLLLGFNRSVRLTSGTLDQLDPSNPFKLPDSSSLPDLENNRGTFYYAKLHGSSNWLSSGGIRRMVIGNEKAAQIEAEPRLAAYQGVFDRILSSGNIRLLVIGYGFGDEHINKVIAGAAKQHNLELFVISPQAASCFKRSVCGIEHGDTIYDALKGYFPHALLDIFPPDQSPTQEWKRVRRNFFGENA